MFDGSRTKYHAGGYTGRNRANQELADISYPAKTEHPAFGRVS
jgi:hypothetical protein